MKCNCKPGVSASTAAGRTALRFNAGRCPKQLWPLALLAPSCDSRKLPVVYDKSKLPVRQSEAALTMEWDGVECDIVVEGQPKGERHADKMGVPEKKLV